MDSSAFRADVIVVQLTELVSVVLKIRKKKSKYIKTVADMRR
jgi:hypothetical protein